VLPLELYELCLQTFGSEEACNQVVRESSEIHITYAGVPVTLRILAGDNAAERLGAETEDGQEYGLETLLQLARRKKQEKINMVDMGANYGVVSIATYLKFPGLLRAVVVEPIPSTYFFLRWNLWLNRVPDHSFDSFVDRTKPVGVVALHRGVTENEGDSLQMCSQPGWSMNARATEPTDATPCDCEVMTCTTVPGITTHRLFDDFFKLEDITLLKMDCEGCEVHGLPAIARYPLRIHRLVGELHVPEEEHIDIACLFDSGRYMTKVCRLAEDEWSCCLPLDCFPERAKCKW
jgi:FkbM family methyltransferase